MKIIYKSIVVLILLISSAAMYTSCTKEDLPNNGEPIIKYIRVADPASADSLLTAGLQGNMIVIVGENLQGAVQIFFNDLPGQLVSTFITDKTIFTVVPADPPKEITNKLTLVFKNGKTLEYDFAVTIKPPAIKSMSCEYLNAGDTAIIKGAYFYKPLSVSFSGNVAAELLSVTDSAIQVIVPVGAQVGPITVTTNFGVTESTLWFRDNRNMILNYDNLTSSGSWRPGILASANGIDGKYLVLKGILDKNQRTDDDQNPPFSYAAELWGVANGRPQGNLFTGNPADLSLKFEASIPNWYGSYLNICFAPWSQNNANNEYWSNDLNARAYWGPWDVADKVFKTKGWITVTIPISNFKYALTAPTGDLAYTPMAFNQANTGSLSFWVVGSPKAKASPFEIHIDNVRIVPN